jgi:hypothetical protein
MKTRIDIEKEFNEKFEDAIDENRQIGLVEQDIKSFISSIRQNDVDELIEWAEGMRKKARSSSYLYEQGEAHALSDIITHLKSIKEKI